MVRYSTLMLLAASAAAAGGQLLFKLGAQGKTQALDFLNLYIALGLLMYGAGTAIWIYALSKEKLVVVYAFSALTFALVYLGGVMLLGERLSLRATGGVACVLFGLYLIAA